MWGEYIDSRSGEMFYFLPDKGVSQWDKPDMPPPPSTALVLDDLHEDDIVLFRFPGFHTDVHATVAKVRIDNDNGERLATGTGEMAFRFTVPGLLAKYDADHSQRLEIAEFRR